jgi:hypothetical protein
MILYFNAKRMGYSIAENFVTLVQRINFTEYFYCFQVCQINDARFYGNRSFASDIQDYMISMYFRQQWREPRLAYPPVDKGKTSSIRLPDKSWETLWIPDTYFRNEKSAQFSKVTVNNRLMRLNSTGMVWYVSR